MEPTIIISGQSTLSFTTNGKTTPRLHLHQILSTSLTDALLAKDAANAPGVVYDKPCITYTVLDEAPAGKDTKGNMHFKLILEGKEDLADLISNPFTSYADYAAYCEKKDATGVDESVYNSFVEQMPITDVLQLISDSTPESSWKAVETVKAMMAEATAAQ